MKLNIEINLDILKDDIAVEIWDIFLILFWFFYIGNWGNWNLNAKNIFQFIELIIAKFFIRKQKNIFNSILFTSKNIDFFNKKNIG
jgi:hypothetical protein